MTERTKDGIRQYDYLAVARCEDCNGLKVMLFDQPGAKSAAEAHMADEVGFSLWLELGGRIAAGVPQRLSEEVLRSPDLIDNVGLCLIRALNCITVRIGAPNARMDQAIVNVMASAFVTQDPKRTRERLEWFVHELMEATEAAIAATPARLAAELDAATPQGRA